MKNMVDYVRSFREPFSVTPLSEVDSLVLSELAYLRFESLLDNALNACRL